MARKFNLASLFEPWKWDPKLLPYHSYDKLFAALGSRKKPIWREDWMLAALEEGDPRFGTYLRRAFEHGLAVTLVNRNNKAPRKLWNPELYLLKLDQTWRISALHALLDTAWTRGSQWTDANEANESVLLGYTAKQRAAWLDAQHRRGIHGGGRTIYALLTAAQRKTVASVGRRCFGPAESVDGMTLYYHRGDVVVRRDALGRLPRGTTLARASVHWRAIEPLFGPLKKLRGLVQATLTRELAEATSAKLLTNVELLTRSGWK